MEIKATCQMCGKPYIKKNGRSMFCSDVCKKVRAKQRYEAEKDERLAYQRKWREEHSDEAKERFKERHPDYGRDRSRRLRNSQEYKRTCLFCGKEFTTWLPQKKTCSDECRKAWKKKKDRERERIRTRRKSPEQEHARWIKRRYGSEEAHQAYLTECEKKKQAQMEQTRLRRLAEKEAKRIYGECAVCGKPFWTYNPVGKTCSTKCSKKLAYARKQNRIPKDQMVDKDITLEALYRRDSGVCYLCGGKCDWNDKNGNIVGGMYPSIDHIIPVSRGGFHAWDNVRLAHFECNTKKSNDIIPNVEKMIPENAYSAKKEPKQAKKKTAQYSKEGTFIAEYESAAEAARKTGFKEKQIQNCARGEVKTYRGYVWAYVS